MATSMMSSLALKPSPFLERLRAMRGLPSLARTSSFRVQASGGKKIKTDTPYGTGGGMALRNGLDASGRKLKGKGVYQFVDKFGANVDGYRNHRAFDLGCDSCCTPDQRISDCGQYAFSLLELPDSEILLRCSTSPIAESPDFVENERREKAHRPFRCLDIQYRRELIRVYLSAVEQICTRFVDEKKKLQTWIDDKAQWSSFHSFGLGIDPNTRRLMSRDKTGDRMS